MKQLKFSGLTVVRVCGIILACLAVNACQAMGTGGEYGSNEFSFIAAGDMRNFAAGAPAGKRYFDGACAALQHIGPGNFMVTPGDFDPPAPVVLDQYLGTNYLVSRAYVCGHTHNASITKVEGVWQADSGHARGAGDKGSPSTFLKFRVAGTKAWVDVYRADPNGVIYQLRKTVQLD